MADAGAANWKNVNGTGPFMLTDFVQGNSNTYTKNPIYWDKDKINGGEYKLPFVDKLVYRTIKDEATFVTALRTAKLDILETIRWQNVEELKKSAPAAQVVEVAQHVGHVPGLAGRHQAVRRHPRAPRAQHGGQQAGDRLAPTTTATPSCSPIRMHPDYNGYFEPLEAMPASVKELFEYNPDKAKKLLAEAGYPNGFSFKVQVCACNPDHMDLLPLVAAYLEKVGVKIEIQPMEYAAFLSAMTSRKMTPGYFMNNGHTNPTTTIRKSFTTGQQWNPSGWSDPAYDKKMDEVYAERDEGKRQAMLKEMTREILDKAPYIWLPTPYIYHGLVAVGEELQRRAARRRGASRPDLCAHLGRPGLEEEDGLLRSAGLAPAGHAPPAPARTPWLSPSCRSAI